MKKREEIRIMEEKGDEMDTNRKRKHKRREETKYEEGENMRKNRKRWKR